MDSLKQRLYGLLRRSERYTKTDMVYAASGGFWLLAAQALATLLAIPVSLTFAHFLTQNEFGIYKYGLAAAAVISVFSLTGIATGITRASAKGYDGSLRQGFVLALRTSGLMVLIALVVAAYYAYRGNLMLAGIMTVIAVSAPLFNTSWFYASFLNGKRLFRIVGIYNTWRNLLCGLCLLLTVLLTHHPLIILIVYFLAYSLTGLYFTWLSYKKLRENDLQDPELPRFSLHTSLTNGLATLADRIDSLLLFQVIGAAQLAIYAFAELVPEVIGRFGKMMNTLALPKYATSAKPEGMVRKTLLIALFFLPIVIAYIIAAPYIFAWLLPTYVESVPFTQVLSVMVLINATLPVAYLDAHSAIREKYVLSISSNVIKITLVVLGVFLWGLWGVVMARLASKTIGVGLAFVIARNLKLRT